AGRPGVRVPPHAVKDGRVVLNLAPRAVDRLELADDMVSFQARFNGVAMLVLVPMDAVLAIYAMENGQGMVFPPEAEAQGDAGADDSATGPVAGTGAPADDDAPSPPPRGRGGLRVVK